MKKLSNIIKISILSTVSIMLLTIKSNAAIQIVPTETVLTNVTVSTSYKTCRDLDSLSSTLGTTKLDPHLATNKDWGAVSYLANSAYGLNATYPEADIDTQEGKVGVKKTINGISFYSTTPNVTGVMNWGGNPNQAMYTQSAGINNNTTSLTSQTTGKINLLLENKNTKYVEGLVNGSTVGMAMNETSAWGKYAIFNATDNNKPINIRFGLFGYNVGGYGYDYSGYSFGQANSSVTFRPVIWNIE